MQVSQKKKRRKYNLKMNFFYRENMKSTMIPFISCVLAFFVLLSLSLYYVGNFQTLVNEENNRYLQEIANQINTSLKDKLYANYAVVETFGKNVLRNQDLSLSEILQRLDEDKTGYQYQEVALLDEEGNWYSVNGKKLYNDLLPFVNQMKQEQHPITTNILNLFQHDCVAFLSPMTPFTMENITFIGIAAAADMKTITDTLSLSMFEDNGFAHVITKTGTIVMRAENVNNRFFGYNIFSYFENNTSLTAEDVKELQQHFAEGISGQVSLTREDGTKMLSYYTPTGYEDWFLFAIIPAEILTERTEGFYQQTILACSLLTIVFVILIIILTFSQQRRKKELMKILHTDAITGGRSKLKFEEDAEKALHMEEHGFVLIYANIDKFKYLNEQLGRVFGDRLLKQMNKIFESNLKEAEGEYTARLMADHFAILMGSSSLKQSITRIQRMDQQLKEKTQEMHLPIPLSVSYGIYEVNDADKDIAVMLDKANMARKQLIVDGKDTSHIGIYDALLQQRLDLEQALETSQQEALQKNEFQMYLQPKYNPQTECISGAEALVRWQSPTRGLLFPDQFIPLFEKNGFIVKIDLFIFEEACRFIKCMLEENIPPIPISVNLSRINLNNPDFINDYVAIWEKYHFPASLLEFEITESLIYDNMDFLNTTIHKIHQYGFKVSMDDFGSGYSSLNMLKNVDVDVVKLDRQFFLSNEKDVGKGKLIISSMIELSRKLGIHVVSEGVETKEQVEFLRKEGCDYIQGYYYSKPIPSIQLYEKLSRHKGGNGFEKT